MRRQIIDRIIPTEDNETSNFRHVKDLIILTSGVQVLSLISNYFWFLWLLVSAPKRGLHHFSQLLIDCLLCYFRPHYVARGCYGRKYCRRGFLPHLKSSPKLTRKNSEKWSGRWPSVINFVEYRCRTTIIVTIFV